MDVADIPGLRELWAETLGDPRICVAVLDGPVDQSHPSLANANLTRIETLVPGIADQGPASQHATHVASVIFGQHDGPIKGMAPRCRGLIVPVFEDAGNGSLAPCSQLDLARAITQAVQEGAHIINISGGQFSPSGTAHPLLADVVRNCVTSGVLIVASVGNEGCDCLHVPGALPSVLAVGAMDSRGLPLDFSNWGENYQTQGVLAPGEDILGAKPGGGTATNSGTSYATPLVSGIAALLMSIQLKGGQEPNAQAVRLAILGGAIGCDDEPAPDCRRLLAGRLNVKGATAQILEGVDIMSDSTETHETRKSHVTEDAHPETPVAQIPAPAVQPARTESNAREASGSPPEPAAVTRRESRDQEQAAGKDSADFRRVTASTCGCGCGGGGPARLVYALGQLGYDFGTEARRDSFIQQGIANPHDPGQLTAFLNKPENHAHAASLIWTLNLDAVPIYAIQPTGPFAREAYQRLREFFDEQIKPGGPDRVSIPGVIIGKAALMNGQVVPVIAPDMRGMYNWTTTALVEAVCGKPLKKDAPQKDKEAFDEKAEGVHNFLERVYYELRSLGLTPEERAINFAATNAFEVEKAYEKALKKEMELDSIEVQRSPVCRPESDCWDVKLAFFFPQRQVQTVRKLHRFTVDVSDVIPVTVGPSRSWFVR